MASHPLVCTMGSSFITSRRDLPVLARECFKKKSFRQFGHSPVMWLEFQSLIGRAKNRHMHRDAATHPALFRSLIGRTKKHALRTIVCCPHQAFRSLIGRAKKPFALVSQVGCKIPWSPGGG